MYETIGGWGEDLPMPDGELEVSNYPPLNDDDQGKYSMALCYIQMFSMDVLLSRKTQPT